MPRLRGEARKARNAKIAELLGEGWPPDDVARETGADRATVFRHKARLRDAEEVGEGERPETANTTAQVDGPPVAVPTPDLDGEGNTAGPSEGPQAPDSLETRVGRAYAAGIPAERIASAFDVEPEYVAKVGERLAVERELDVFERLARTNPARWAAIQEQRARDDRKLARDGAIPKETVHKFIVQVRRVCSGLLGSDHRDRDNDFPWFDTWLAELLAWTFPEIGLPEEQSRIYMPDDSGPPEDPLEELYRRLEGRIGPVRKILCVNCRAEIERERETV